MSDSSVKTEHGSTGRLHRATGILLYGVTVVLFGSTAMPLSAAQPGTPFEELTPKFSRQKSPAMVRKIPVPTLAALDYAAYIDNPVLNEPARFKPKVTGSYRVGSITFDGHITDAVADLSATPLTPAELARPLAWRPLVKRLWEVVKDQGFSAITAKINGFKWSDSTVSGSYQQLSAVWIHNTGSERQIWAEIELSPWVQFIPDAMDVDNDGIKEFFARIDVSPVAPAARDSAIAWIRSDYQKQRLSHEEVIDWITDLASYWYPSKNTDVLDWEGSWPGKTTEKTVRRAMRGRTVENPVAVVRGRPFGKPVYNVYIVDVLTDEASPVDSSVSGNTGGSPTSATRPPAPDSSHARFLSAISKRFEIEQWLYTGFTEWLERTAPFRSAEQRFLATLPADQMGYEGRDGWLFFRRDLEYGLGGDLSKQPYNKNPVDHLVELKRLLDEHGVDLLFVPVPNKTEVYYEHLPFETPKESEVLVNPYSRKILADLAAAGVETVDLLPLFLAAKRQADTVAVYQKHDTHWTAAGLAIAADAIADRIRSFSWHDDLVKDSVAYSIRDTVTSRLGDIVDRLPESQRAAYPPVQLMAHRVYHPDGTPFKSDKNAPVLLIGDSFTGVFESVDCKSAGIGAVIAAKSGIPVDIITSWGGGPGVRERFIRRRLKELGSKRLVIYMMVARDLYDYSQGWTPLKDAMQ